MALLGRAERLLSDYREVEDLLNIGAYAAGSNNQFDLAIADLEHAAQLIEGTENVTEPDGLPNALNIPISPIWAGLGIGGIAVALAVQPTLANSLTSNVENPIFSLHLSFVVGSGTDSLRSFV